MYIALFIASILFFALYFIITIFIYEKNNAPERYDIKNHFAFELFVKRAHGTAFIDLALILGAACYGVNHVLFAINYFNVLNLTCAIVAVVIAFSSVVISILPLSRLREHCIFAIFFSAGVTILNAALIFSSVNMLQILEEKWVYLPIVINALVTIVGIFVMFNPTLFKFNMVRNEDGTLVRPKFITLAFSEWLLLIAMLFSQVYIVLFPYLK